MAETTAAIAKRCVEDGTFAQQILEGDSYPEVRDAIMADIEAAGEVQGFLNPQPLPPGPDRTRLLSSVARQQNLYVSWSTLPLANLRALYY